MNRHVTLAIVAVVVAAAAVFSSADEETRKSEIATFESAQQDKVPYLELRNVRDLLNAMEVDCSNCRLKVELVDKDGKPVRSGQLKRSGPHPELGKLTLPFESSIRISLECRNFGLGGAVMVATDSGAWQLAEEENGKVFLRATLTGDKSNPEWKTWHGEVQTPLIPVTWRSDNILFRERRSPEREDQ